MCFFVEEPSNNPEIFDNAHERLGDYLSQLFKLVHLRSGITYRGRDSSFHAGSILLARLIRTKYAEDSGDGASKGHSFQSRGYCGALRPSQERLEGVITFHAGFATLQTNKAERVIRGLDTLFNGLMEPRPITGFISLLRSSEVPILPDIGETKKQFVRRCQTFARAGCDTQSPPTGSIRHAERDGTPAPLGQGRAESSRRGTVISALAENTTTRQHLARDAYSRVLRNAKLRQHFQTDDTIANFWKLPGRSKALAMGGPPLYHAEPLVKELITLCTLGSDNNTGEMLLLSHRQAERLLKLTYYQVTA